MKPPSLIAVLLLVVRPPSTRAAAPLPAARCEEVGTPPCAEECEAAGSENRDDDEDVLAADDARGGPPSIDDDDDYNYDYGDIIHAYILDSDDDYDASSGKPPTLAQMSRLRGCHELPTVGQPLYAEEDWERLRRLYREQGGGGTKFQTAAPDGFAPPLRAGQTSDGKGRGVFASRDIKKGELTYAGTDHYAFFTDGVSYRRFVDALSRHEACDVEHWVWTVDTEWGPVLFLLLDDNVLQNNINEEGEANTGGRPEDRRDTDRMFHEFALRDIKEGEELLCDYNLFTDDQWGHFGLM